MTAPMVVRMHRAVFAARCQANGVTVNDAMACVGFVDGDVYGVNIAHEKYPATIFRPAAHVSPSTAKATPGGPGTELAKLLEGLGITPTQTCRCKSKAAQMDAWGPDECAKPERIAEVVAVMREEAAKRGLPFVDIAGRILVRRAIKNARKAASSASTLTDP